MTWLSRVWISPAEHARIVEELQTKIDRLEADYVAVTWSLIREMQARRNTEAVRDVLPATDVGAVPLRSGRVIPFERRASEKSPVLVTALEEHQI